MKITPFDALLKSVLQAHEIVHCERPACREFFVDEMKLKHIRAITQPSPERFAVLHLVDVGTLRNLEQCRRHPAGPEKALPRAIQSDPDNALRALGVVG